MIVVMVLVGLMLIGTGHYAVFEEHANAGWIWIVIGIAVASFPFMIKK